MWHEDREFHLEVTDNCGNVLISTESTDDYGAVYRIYRELEEHVMCGACIQLIEMKYSNNKYIKSEVLEEAKATV